MDKTFRPEFDLDLYNAIREDGAPWFVPERRGVIAVHGAEAVQFLNGLLTNDVAKLEAGKTMLAAFPNAKGRLIALVRIENEGERLVFDTEEGTYGSVLANLTRFTFAGEFFVDDLTEEQTVVPVRGERAGVVLEGILEGGLPEGGSGISSFGGVPARVLKPVRASGSDIRVPAGKLEAFSSALEAAGAVKAEGPLAEILRVETGTPVFGTDMDEDTVVPEIGIEEVISYNKGCYIGQEVIARIHFRGKVAKELKGVVFEAPEALVSRGSELLSKDGKSAGVITSKGYSPKLKKHIAMAYVRNAYFDPGTELLLENQSCRVCDLPFIP